MNRLRLSSLKRLYRRLQPIRPPSPTHVANEDPADRHIIDLASRYSMTGRARILALLDAVRYCERRGIPGAFAECGVWRGGSVLAMILALQELGVSNRDIYLCDTFDGMTRPGEHDTSPYEKEAALTTWNRAVRSGQRAWHHVFSPERFGEDQVRSMLLRTGYPSQFLHIVKGPVEQTLPSQMPATLALLRLDTDWYESTRHELEHLYPRLADGGVVIIDDYGHWRGCRRAVDEYFARPDVVPLLWHRVDYSCLMAVKR